MAFSYNSTALAEPVNHLRFLVQDTTAAGAFFQDEEISFVAGAETNIYRAAARLCRTIAARLAKTPNQENTTVTFEAQARAREYRLLADDYDNKAGRLDQSLNTPAGVGIRLPKFSDKDPAFTRDLHLLK